MSFGQARQPRQSRSAASLERVVQSAEKILAEHTYEDLTITRIVAESGVSVGAIYARFSNKEGIFNALVARFMNDTLQEFQDLDRDAWASSSLDEAIDQLVEVNARLYRRHRGILRAIFIRTRLVQDSELVAATETYNESVAANLLELMQLHAHHIEHPDSSEAINVAIETITAMLREHFVLRNDPPSTADAIGRISKLVKVYLQPGRHAP